jgi:hypothetical protein
MNVGNGARTELRERYTDPDQDEGIQHQPGYQQCDARQQGCDGPGSPHLPFSFRGMVEFNDRSPVQRG